MRSEIINSTRDKNGENIIIVLMDKSLKKLFLVFVEKITDLLF
jgi:hypothetical protein